MVHNTILGLHLGPEGSGHRRGYRGGVSEPGHVQTVPDVRWYAVLSGIRNNLIIITIL